MNANAIEQIGATYACDPKALPQYPLRWKAQRSVCWRSWVFGVSWSKQAVGIYFGPVGVTFFRTTDWSKVPE